MYYTVYKITNLINTKIYIGAHQTEDLNDTYMGSGTHILRAVRKYGVQNFKKEYLAIFDNPDDMFNMESQLVNKEFIENRNTYNLNLGGTGAYSDDIISVVNSEGLFLRVSKTDPRYLSGELAITTLKSVVVRDVQGTKFRVLRTDPRYLSGELVHYGKGKVRVQDASGCRFVVDIKDPRYLSGELTSVTALTHRAKVTVKDKQDNVFKVSKTDPRYLSGELVSNHLGYKHTDEAKKKISIANKNNLTGERNPCYGKVWMYNPTTKENKTVRKEDVKEWMVVGWIKGRKIKEKVDATKKICSVCGACVCTRIEICSSPKVLKSLHVFFNLDVSLFGSIRIYDEYDKIRALLKLEYYEQGLSTLDITKKYNITSTQRLDHIFKYLGIKARSRSNAGKNFYSRQKINYLP